MTMAISSRLGHTLMRAARRSAAGTVKVAGAWIFVVSGGPSVDYLHGLRGGWISQLGVAWER